MSAQDRNRRPLYAQPPRRAQRSTLATYAPLILTLTVASAGLAAWIWSERRSSSSDDDEDAEFYRRYASTSDRPHAPSTSGGTAPPAYRSTEADPSAGQDTFVSRAYESVGGAVNAGVAAVTGGVAAAGTALGLYGEQARSGGSSDAGRSARDKRVSRTSKEKEDGFSDHERWSEEAVSRKDDSKGKQPVVNGKRTSVAVIVSADGDLEGLDDSIGGLEHASLLSHLPLHHDQTKTDLFVLIYAPNLGQQQISGNNPQSATGLSGSYSTISLPDSKNRLYAALHQQAEALVTNQAQILPFASPTGYVHMLRHLAPSLVYLQDTAVLSGSKGENLAQLKGWVGQTVVVVGDDGSGGLADTETETEDEGGRKKGGEPWYEVSDLVGLGKGVEVVDVRRVGDDWAKRVLG